MPFIFLLYPLLAFLFVLSHSAYAGTEDYKQACCCSQLPPINKQHHWYADLGVGWTFNTNDYNGHVSLANSEPDLFLTNGNNSNILLAISGGYNWFFSHDWIPAASLGIEYSYLPERTINGQLEQFSDPNLINYDFSYKTQHNSLSLLGKLNLYRWNQIMPFVVAGVGSSWSKTSSYQEHALPGVSPPRFSPNFTDNWESSWKYTLGIGVDYQPTLNFLMSLSYRYDDLGNNDSGHGVGFNYPQQKISKKAYANTVMLNARYLFA